MSQFIHPTRFFKTHFSKERNNNLIKIIIISLFVGLIGGAISQLTMNYFVKKDLLLILERSKQDSLAGKQTIIEKKDEIIINQDEKIEQLVPELIPVVVNIYKKKESPMTKNILDQIYSSQDLAGNGLVIANDGWIISNNQVIKDSIEKYIVVAYDGKFQEIEKIIKDSLTGIVFLKIKISNNLTPAKLADWDEVKIGQSILVLNKMDFLEKKFILSNIANLNFKNIVQSKKSLSSSEKVDDYILIQDKLEFNYNGSPLFNLKGEVVGIMNFIENNLQTAIGINYFKNIIKKALQTNQINRPYLGVNYLNLNGTTIKGFNQNGALIISVEQDSVGGSVGVGFKSAPTKPAPTADKLKKGDIIIKVEKEEISEKKSLTSLINEYQPNQNIKLTIIRGEKEIEVEVRLKEI